MLCEQDMNEEAYRDGSGTDLWIGSDQICHPELRMRSANVWDMTQLQKRCMPYCILEVDEGRLSRVFLVFFDLPKCWWLVLK